MRHLALLLAASSVLATGCVSSGDCTRTVSVGWPSFQLANGASTTSCAVAGVSFVDVFMDDQPVQRVACTQGGLSVVGVPSGAHRFTVEGLDASATILLRDEVTAGSACGETLVDTHPAEGTFTLDYHFTPNDVCTSGGSYIWFSIYDQIAQTVTAVADETANTTRYVCSAPISFVMPAGAYTLQRVEEVVPSGAAYLPAATNCSPATFSVSPAVETVLQASLADTTTFCPAAAAQAGAGRPKMLAKNP